MSNLDIYNAVRKPPAEAIKPIAAGRLKGKSDINPMWRIKALTEQFGPCGVGWKYSIVEKRLEPAPNGEVAAFVDINLFVKVSGEWSEPIPGTGGSSFVANEKNGPYVSDECFKMALTDALSVGCKALGFGADIYWEKDRGKNNQPPPEQQQPQPQKQQPQNGQQAQVPPPPSGSVDTSRPAHDKIMGWIEAVAGKVDTGQKLADWFLNDDNQTLVSEKTKLNATDLSAINRHFEATRAMLDQKGVQQ